MEVVKDVACPNPKCPKFGTRGGESVILRRRYGPDEIRFLRCRACHKEFSERQGTPLFDLRIPRAKIVDVVRHLGEGTGVRATHRLTGVSRVGIDHILQRVGKHAKALHAELVRDLKVPEVQMDEMWSLVGKKRQASHGTGEGRARARKPVGSHGRGRTK